MTIDDLARMMADMKTELKADIAELRVYRETEAQRCPYREDIARGANNVRAVADTRTKIDTVENRLNDYRVEIARTGAMAGGPAGGIIAGALLALGKALGWF